MSDGYKVLMSSLLALSRTFGKEAEELSTTMSCTDTSTPDTGGSASTAALTDALQAAHMTTGQLSAVIAGHGKKLVSACAKYQDAEESSTKLCHDLTRLITG